MTSPLLLPKVTCPPGFLCKGIQLPYQPPRMSNSQNQSRRARLVKTAQETKAALPGILKQIPIDAIRSQVYNLSQLPPLDPTHCPAYNSKDNPTTSTTGTPIHVLNADTLDCAIHLHALPTQQPRDQTNPPQNQNTPSSVLVLNLASEYKPGGGWLTGALAQEESICYRSSLYLSLHRSYYPLGNTSAIYTPTVVIIRDSYSSGHNLLSPPTDPSDLPIISVLSIPALRCPKISSDGKKFANPTDRETTKEKMRLNLRVAARNKHTRLVLGALGCGAFKNPAGEVAACWLEVLKEDEFKGGWWEDIVFAVLDKGSDGGNGGMGEEGNFEIFRRVLDGVVV
ncbi:hypothetical protein EJ08DRAFT_621821 [Tothia fuscella]|uniref:Microbial-type PARG catalytic domain-containing protein n=1 Tax=Tothia fuscella TaxID=1048955 RepID=A0A9P4TRV8_9PEZI|nr:hypothetical protein EJ08DRAFT_621821 [Tothia fuscella]